MYQIATEYLSLSPVKNHAYKQAEQGNQGQSTKICEKMERNCRHIVITCVPKMYAFQKSNCCWGFLTQNYNKNCTEILFIQKVHVLHETRSHYVVVTPL